MFTRNAGGAVNENENHATEGPSYAEKANAITRTGLFLVTDDGGDGDIEEEEGGDELGDEGSVEGPELNLGEVDERGGRRVEVVLPLLTLFGEFFGHCERERRKRLCEKMMMKKKNDIKVGLVGYKEKRKG